MRRSPYALVRWSAPAHGAVVELFSHSWQALRAAVAALPDEDFDQPSGSAAGRAAALADPALRVSTQDKVLTAGDYLSAYVLEWTPHHLDLTAHLPSAAAPPRRDPRPGPHRAGADRRGPVPRLVLRRGRAACRHRTPHTDRRRAGRSGRARGEPSARPRLITGVGRAGRRPSLRPAAPVVRPATPWARATPRAGGPVRGWTGPGAGGASPGRNRWSRTPSVRWSVAGSPFQRAVKIWIRTGDPSLPVAVSTANGSSPGRSSPVSSRSSRRASPPGSGRPVRGRRREGTRSPVPRRRADCRAGAAGRRRPRYGGAPRRCRPEGRRAARGWGAGPSEVTSR